MATVDVCDQVVIVGRVSTRERVDHELWFHEIKASLRLDPRDLSVQVKLTIDGEWHRKAIGGRRTACGRALGGYASRDESYVGTLCDEGCFSEFERVELARASDADDDDAHLEDDETNTPPWAR